MKLVSVNDFKVVKNIKLSNLPTLLNVTIDDDEKEEALLEVQRKLSERQDVMYPYLANKSKQRACCVHTSHLDVHLIFFEPLKALLLFHHHQ